MATLLFNEVQFLADIIDDIATLPMKYPYDYVFPETHLPGLPKQSHPFELKEYKVNIKYSKMKHNIFINMYICINNDNYNF